MLACWSKLHRFAQIDHFLPLIDNFLPLLLPVLFVLEGHLRGLLSKGGVSVLIVLGFPFRALSRALLFQQEDCIVDLLQVARLGLS